DAGGDMYCLGEGGKGKKWTVGVRNPFRKNEIIERLCLQNLAVATSGNYENFFEDKRKRYGHIINPRDGSPVENDIASVTVIAKDCLTADALTKVIFVLGKESGLKLIEKLPAVKAIVFTR
ncbi:MAG: FAD:protein FMN transferase, partial [Candidatus Omnitrophica bacterium]|nr:FAD:protein FMN transferase [Candidatus Omnitrophota bacterium]